MPLIRRFREADWPSVWPLLRTTFAAGDTYAYSPQSTEAEIHRAWVDLPSSTYVACAPDGRLLGTYYLKPNQAEKVLPQCDASASMKPCWRIVKDATKCPTGDNFILEVVRSEAPPPDTHMIAYCVTES